MIYLVRHTTPNILPGVCYGQSNVPLAASYPIELAVVQQRLPDIIDKCFSSPLARCRQLAEDLYTGPVQTDARLLELSFGDWELKHWNELDQTTAVFWGEHFITQACPDGESFLELQHRVLNFWREITTTSAEKTIVIVAHGGVIRVILAHLQKLPLEKAFELVVDYGQVIPVRAGVALERSNGA